MRVLDGRCLDVRLRVVLTERSFEKRRYDENIKNLVRVRSVPSDTQMRTILDLLEPDLLRPMFNDEQIERGSAGELSAISGVCAGRFDPQTLQLGYRSDDHSRQHASFSPPFQAVHKKLVSCRWLCAPPAFGLSSLPLRYSNRHASQIRCKVAMTSGSLISVWKPGETGCGQPAATSDLLNGARKKKLPPSRGAYTAEVGRKGSSSGRLQKEHVL